MSTQTGDIQAVEKLGQARDAIVGELRKTIVGMDEVIDQMMIAVFARGHCLLVGVPGLAKTRKPASGASSSRRGRSSPICCWPMKSTGPLRKRRPRCLRRCRRSGLP